MTMLSLPFTISKAQEVMVEGLVFLGLDKILLRIIPP
jgi:hypothetical protein